MDRHLSQYQARARTHDPLIPGDREREAEAIRRKEGIRLLKPVVDDLLEISKKTEMAVEI